MIIFLISLILVVGILFQGFLITKYKDIFYVEVQKEGKRDICRFWGYLLLVNLILLNLVVTISLSIK